ncbi:hypothetical protein F8388_025677 [Cannabis sativa]|uniref:Disease resistance N-terminal domain-containing protein n=1 Tax=Cannabis sativa TaxID=3483 RepID=A0A7J6G1H8_CANSA|nr:hypothetical protein F8388_025677 [Cannabis sativa]
MEEREHGNKHTTIASPYVEEFFFKAKNESASVVSQRLFKMKSTFNSLAAVRFEVENKRIKNPAVEKWLDDLLDVVDDAEDFFGDIQYNAMKPDKADESKKEKRKAISKLLSCFSKPSNSADRVRNANMEVILKRLEYVANQIGNFNLEKNVGEVKPTERLRLKTSLPDEPELYETLRGTFFVMHDLIVDLARTICGKYSFLLEQNDDIDRLQKKTRHLGCVMELSTDNKVSSYDFKATRCLPATLTPLMGKTLQELHLRNCGSSFTSFHLDLFPNLKTLHIESSHYFEAVSMSDGFVSFPYGGLIAPKLSELEIINCPNLKWLPKMMISLSSLESLIIRDCPLIEPCPENEGGLPIASPYVEEFFFKAKNESASVVSQRLFKMKSTFNSLAAVRFEVENKRIKNPAVEKWLDDLLDVVDDAEDFFGDIQYNAMKPDKADESKKEKRKAISKLLSCFSKPSNSADRVRNANMEVILKRLEYVANQIGNFNLEKNVGEVKPTERLRLKTSLPDEPELYVSMSLFIKTETLRGTFFVMHDLIVDLARTICGKYSCLLEQNDDIDRL